MSNIQMEKAMTYALNPRDFFPYVDNKPTAGSNVRASKRRLVRRILHAIFESRQAQADPEIARFLARSGGRFTDDIERQLTQHLLTGSWSVREG